MNSYYQSLLQEIHKELDQKDYDKALRMIQTELDLPYVPREELEVLQNYKSECLAHIERPVVHPDLESLIHGSLQEQEKAVALLQSCNLRMMHEEVETLLCSSKLLDETKGELIESLMEQKIEDPYKMKKSGLEITFIPSIIVPSSQDATIQEVRDYFDQWFACDNPTFLRFCNRLLDQEVLENRPLDFEDCQALPIAKALVRLVCEAFGQNEDFQTFCKEKNLEEIVEVPLRIERRGENYE